MDSIRDPNPIRFVVIYLLWAELAEHTGDMEQKTYALESAVARLPEHVAALETLAMHCLEKGNLDRAIVLLQKARQHTGDPHLLVKLAMAHRLKNDLARAQHLEKQAVKDFESLLAIYPEALAAEAAGFFMTIPNGRGKARHWAEVAVRVHPISANHRLLMTINSNNESH